MTKKTILILGAGPAGLTAAYELASKSDKFKIIVLDKNNCVGGMCRSLKYKNNYMDIGGHRYFTKFNKIKKWWLNILPLQTAPAKDDILLSRNLDLLSNNNADPEKIDKVMLKRFRYTRIFYLNKFFDYPVKLNFTTFKGLGLTRMGKIFFSYVHAKIFPIKPEKTAEDFLTNSFGKELYSTFFKNYTEKLWGIQCDKISAEWGKERIRGIKFWETVLSFLRSLFPRKDTFPDDFLYPKLGPGQIWEEVAKSITEMGVEIRLNSTIGKIITNKSKIIKIETTENGKKRTIDADYVISSLAIQDLINMMNDVPKTVQETAEGLVYRNFRSAAILLKKLKLKNKTSIKSINNLLPDTWIYIQENNVKMGRMQIFNNWSPYLPENSDNVWIAFEYFCSDSDDIWLLSDKEFEKLAIDEGVKIGIIDTADVLDATSAKIEKAYPAYFGSYNNFDTIKEYSDSIKNLYLIGRNGMHKYINIDHAMLSGMEAAKNILQNLPNKANIWNTDTDKFLD